MQNMHHMADMALAKKVFARYEKFYEDNQGWDIDHIIAGNNDLKMQMHNLQQGIENKNKEITQLKA